MAIIEVACNTFKAAERQQLRLYDRFESVILIQAPRFGEAGTYAWQVREPIVSAVKAGSE